MTVRSLFAITLPLAAAVASTTALATTPTFVTPATAYLSSADIPAGFYAGGLPTLLETLEDGSLDATLSANRGSLIGPGEFNGTRDSVDGDDGLIDGTCGPQSATCASWFDSSGSLGVRFTFVGSGALPTAFGVVWTDASPGASVTFSATGAEGQSLGSVTVGGFVDNSVSATTAEDRFFGVTFSGGVRSIFISTSSGGIEVDHIQYGQMAAVPEPESWALMAVGLAGLAGWTRRRCGPPAPRA
jgi:hypothetical protein